MNKTKKIKVGNIYIGGDAPVSIQSMLNVKADDIDGNVHQAKELYEAGCEIIRFSVPDMNAVRLIDAVKSTVPVPVVADIHFDYKLALESVAAGVDKVRINPGNIGEERRVKAVADVCNQRNIPIRVGVNGGSLEKDILTKYGKICPQALVDSGMYHISLLEKYDFNNIILSIKSSSVPMMFEAYKLAAEKTDYPLHLGVTEAGTYNMGIIKSAAGIGGLLLDGIGNTIRVSLTDEPVKEVKAAADLLKAVGLRNDGVKFVSCPTCGRTKINLIGIAKEAEKRLQNVNKDITVAVMGCVVNGPGEAKNADVGLAGGDGCGVIFKKGEVLRKVAEENLLDELIKEIEKM